MSRRTEKSRKIWRRQRRQKKLRYLKAKLSQAKDLKETEAIINKIKRISVSLNMDIPKKN